MRSLECKTRSRGVAYVMCSSKQRLYMQVVLCRPTGTAKNANKACSLHSHALVFELNCDPMRAPCVAKLTGVDQCGVKISLRVALQCDDRPSKDRHCTDCCALHAMAHIHRQLGARLVCQNLLPFLTRLNENEIHLSCIRGGAGRGSPRIRTPPASDRTTDEIRANSEIFGRSVWVGAVNRQLLIDMSCIHACRHAPRRGRLLVAGVNAWPRRPTKLP